MWQPDTLPVESKIQLPGGQQNEEKENS